MDESEKSQKIISSSTDENEKEAKNARHPWMKVRKR